MKASDTDWEGLFSSHFDRLKQSFKKDHPGKSYERNHPAEAAYAEFHRSLPVPVRTMAISLKPGPWHSVDGGRGYFVAFDLSRLGESSVEYMGDKSCSLSEFEDVLKTEFGSRALGHFPPTPEFPLNQFTDWDPEKRWYTMFLPYDIVEKLEELYREMWLAFRSSIWIDLSERFTFEIDFNIEFDLKPDQLLAKRELLKAARPGEERWEWRHPEKGPVKLTLENLQRDIQAIQLIPNVPKGIQDIFAAAKKLYIFGYFDVSFRTVSRHYAAMALESALKERYWQEIGQPVVLENRKGESRTLNRANHSQILRLCFGDSRWNLREIKVNGHSFSHSNKRILDFMESKELLTRWERDMCNLLISVRNTLSHPSSISIMPSDKGWLEMAAKFINILFIKPSRKKQLLEEHRRKQRLKSFG